MSEITSSKKYVRKSPSLPYPERLYDLVTELGQSTLGWTSRLEDEDDLDVDDPDCGPLQV